ncbi:MAG: UvrD-helicase domain-containing protein [Acidobacteria bacterium]|nr:UvrD-helicase domain-containing protein [Acidobacteriota bacterium]
MTIAPTSTESRILDGLNPAQHEAVTHGEGPLLIIAGAGTGKTTVLTRRIAHLIATKRARPEEILALTFTEKAAAEMSERVDQLIPYGYAETQISTFHAFGDRALRDAALEIGLNPEFRVLSQPEQIIFLRERIFDLPLRRFRPLGDPTRHLRALCTLVSRAKDEDVSPEAYRAWAEGRLAAAATDEERDEAERHVELAAFYAAHQKLLAEAGLVDFGDQIHRTLGLLRERPATLAGLRERYRWILVDEFQDTNHAQLEMLRLLAGESANLTVVGDDDQAIYRWRGAAAANLLAFRRLYAGCREVVLTENYRSTQVILDAAARLVSFNNPYRLEAIAGIDKRLRSDRAEGAPVRHLHHDTVSAEADGVAAEIAERVQAGARPRDVAILVRSNDEADPFLRALNVKGLPHRFSGSRGLYAREEVRLLVSFLRVLANPEDSVSLFYLAASEVYRVPEMELLRLNHYAQRKTRPLLEVLKSLPGNEDLQGVSGATREAAARLLTDVERAAEEVPRRRTGEVLYGYLQWSGLLGRLSREASAEAEVKVRNIARFFESVKAYGDVAEHDRVPAFVAHLDLLRDAGDDPAVAEADPDDDAVHVLTVHKAKGLEFPIVFLVGCAESRFPLQRRGEKVSLPEALVREEVQVASGHLHEERRLFYVAMTRAMDELVLTSAADYGTARARKVSRFVVEALDLPNPAPVPRKSRALEALARHQPAPEPRPMAEAPIPEDELLRLSHSRIDDYETCPLKYRYVHVLRVPLLAHHTVVYGHAVHEAVRRMFEARLAGRDFNEDDLVEAFRIAWVSEGFLSREHEERRRRVGEEMLRRFFHEETASAWAPTSVEEEFAFDVERNRIQGRYDLVAEKDGRVTIVDFKTGEVTDPRAAQKRADESLQLDIYALAHQRTRGRLPDRVELRFLESGLAAGRTPTPDRVGQAEERIRAAADGIRRREFPPRPTWMACGQCPFREICPHTARGSEAGA